MVGDLHKYMSFIRRPVSIILDTNTLTLPPATHPPPLLRQLPLLLLPQLWLHHRAPLSHHNTSSRTRTSFGCSSSSSSSRRCFCAAWGGLCHSSRWV